MKKYETKNVMEMIRNGKIPSDTPEWIRTMNALYTMPVYLETNEQKRRVVIDQEGNHFYHLYIKKPSTNVQAFNIKELKTEANNTEISLLISISEDEPESILIEEPSDFIYFVKVEKTIEGVNLI